jgi:hypothetical protein
VISREFVLSGVSPRRRGLEVRQDRWREIRILEQPERGLDHGVLALRIFRDVQWIPVTEADE